MARTGSAAFGFHPSQAQEVREGVRAAEVGSRLTQDADIRQKEFAALQAQVAEAVSRGAPRTALPEIHPNMSRQDIAAAARALNRFTVSRAPSTPAVTQKPSVGAIAGAQPGVFDGGAIATPSAPAPNTSRVSTVPAIGADGQQMRNFDLTPRTLQRIPSIGESNKSAFGQDFFNISHDEQRGRLKMAPTSASGGVTTSTGASPFNFKGERSIQTPGTLGETGKEYNPARDLTKSPIAAGDSLLPKGATGGVMIEPKYRTPGADAFGYTTRGPAVAGQSDPDPMGGFPAGGKPSIASVALPGDPTSRAQFLRERAPVATQTAAPDPFGVLGSARSTAGALASAPESLQGVKNAAIITGAEQANASDMAAHEQAKKDDALKASEEEARKKAARLRTSPYWNPQDGFSQLGGA